MAFIPGTPNDDNGTFNGGAVRRPLLGTNMDDQIFGDDGKDVLMGFQGNDYLDGGDKDDRLLGGLGVDDLDGGNGNDSLFGDAGNDRLYGGEGKDFLDGGAGSDELIGGYGKDRFFNVEMGDVTDFNPNEDQIVFSQAAIGGALNVGDVGADAFVVGAATSNSAGFIYDDNTGVLFFDEDGIGSQQPLQMAQLDLGLGASFSSGNISIIADSEYESLFPELQDQTLQPQVL